MGVLFTQTKRSVASFSGKTHAPTIKYKGVPVLVHCACTVDDGVSTYVPGADVARGCSLLRAAGTSGTKVTVSIRKIKRGNKWIYL